MVDTRFPTGPDMGNVGPGPTLSEDSGDGGDLSLLSDEGSRDHVKRSGFGVFLNLAVGIGSSLDTINGHLKRLWNRLQDLTPSDVVFAQGAVTNSDGDAVVIDLGTPSQGFYWEVKNVVVGGALVTDTPGGSAGLFVASQATLNSAILANARDIASSFPNVATYSTRQLVVKSGEHLFVVVFGGDDTTQYVAAMCATQFNVAAPGGGGSESTRSL